MSAHTPAPWILEQDTVFIGETRKVQPVLYHGDSEGMANARLISAAPDLLSTLKEMMSVFQDHEQYDEESAEVVSIARAAIAKAEGKQ